MRVLLMSALVSLALAGPAQALEVWHEADDNGDPVVGVFAPGNPPLAWLACTDAACVPAGGGSTLSPGNTPAGTVFEVGLGAETARSAVWGGRISPASPPSVTGEPTVGAAVTPVAGTWTGGWGTELDDLRLEACRDAAGSDCKTLSAPDWEAASTRNGPVVLSPALAGWYLRAADRRRNQNEGRIAIYIAGPSEVPTLTAAPRVAFSPLVGPITSPVEAPVVPSAIPTVSAPHFAPAPTVTFRARALRSRKGLVVGRVSCAVTCSIALAVSDGRRTYRRALRGSGPISLALTAKPRRGTLRVSVSVDGRAPVRGRVRL